MLLVAVVVIFVANYFVVRCNMVFVVIFMVFTVVVFVVVVVVFVIFVVILTTSCCAFVNRFCNQTIVSARVGK